MEEKNYLVFSNTQLSLMVIVVAVATMFMFSGCTDAQADEPQTAREAFCEKIFLKSSLPVYHNGYLKCVKDGEKKYVN